MQSRHSPALLLTAPLLLLALCACEAESGSSPVAAPTAEETGDGTAEEEPSTQEIALAETGWLTVGRDGSVQTTFFDTGGRYRDFRNGEPSGEGTWAQRPDGSICFEPETGLGACWEMGAPEEDGSVIVTDEDGRRVEIRRITYTAPPDDEPGDEEETG
jgi:hypothetical protein